jgi:hypothetical protein
MRIYIIGNDGITLCREPPATVDKGEIAVASREEMHAARLTGKRLLALWNALPGVEKQTKVGDRDTLIDRFWAAIEALPDPDQQSDTKRPSKQDAVIARCCSDPRAQPSTKWRAPWVGSGTRSGDSSRARGHRTNPAFLRPGTDGTGQQVIAPYAREGCITISSVPSVPVTAARFQFSFDVNALMAADMLAFAVGEATIPESLREGFPGAGPFVVGLGPGLPSPP